MLDIRGMTGTARAAARTTARPAGRGYRPFPRGARSTAAVRSLFVALAALIDAVVIMVCASGLGRVYYGIAYDSDIPNSHLQLGLMIAILFAVPNLMRNEYTIGQYLVFKNQIQRSVMPWCLAFFCAFAIGFATQTTAEFSRAASIIFFFVGFGVVVSARMLVAAGVRRGARHGGIAARRLFLLGYEAEMEAFAERYEPWKLGMQVVASSVLRGQESLMEDLALASASARILRPDDVFILVPWSHKETIDSCINAFLRVPASIHLGPEAVLDRFSEARISRIGPMASLNLVSHPLSTLDRVTKRLFDLVIASAALIILAPLLLIVACAIKLDSKGPVIFRQRRYGFNQEPFRIFKFRSMSIMEDHAQLTQATKNDIRITRVGRFMRRYNIDELPQLLNVVRGEMSLVGPRPHALAHDRLFEQNIALYARRHNVKPGITGWAQVNGLRGGISEDEIRNRVEFDLYYIDHWSIWLDIQILGLTILSPKSYRGY